MRPAQVRMFAAGMFVGAALVAVLATPVAKADPELAEPVVDYAITHEPSICLSLDKYPSVPGLMAAYGYAMTDGLSVTDSATAVTLAVMDGCPDHEPILERFITIYAGTGVAA